MDQTGKRFFVRVLSVCYCIQGPTMTEQPKGEALRCLEFGVTLPLWHVLAGTLNQRVLGSIPGAAHQILLPRNCQLLVYLNVENNRLASLRSGVSKRSGNQP